MSYLRGHSLFIWALAQPSHPCVYSDLVGNYWADSPLSMLPIYQELIVSGIRIWVFR